MKRIVVEVEFSVNNTSWKIVRGIKPNVFEIERDGNILNQDAAALDQQKWLEQNVLKMNYKSSLRLLFWEAAPLFHLCNCLQQTVEM